MQTETSLDLRYNIAAMYIAILRDDIATPEQAFAVIEDSEYKLTNEDNWDMLKLKLTEGLTYKQIGEIYGISGAAAANRIRRNKSYKKLNNFKKEIDQFKRQLEKVYG